MSDDHLTTEEISALLDRGAGEASEDDHVASCAACRREMKLLRRMRMALSALDDVEAAPGAWSSIEAELDRRGLAEEESGDRGGSGAPLGPFGRVGWVRAAAAAVLFVGGLGLGTHLASPGGLVGGESPGTASASGEGAAEPPAETTADGTSDDGPGPVEPRPTSESSRLAASGSDLEIPEASGTGDASGEGLTYEEAMRRLEELRARGPSFREAYRNPRAAAEHMARLEALMRASQEALREDPADPALNDFLFEVAEERRSLNRALHLSTLEYR